MVASHKYFKSTYQNLLSYHQQKLVMLLKLSTALDILCLVANAVETQHSSEVTQTKFIFNIYQT